MSVTSGPTSLISSPTPALISNVTSTIMSSITSSSSSPTPTTKGGGGLGLTDPTSQRLLEDARNTSDIASPFVICIAAGILFFFAFCIFRTRIPVLFSPRANMKRHKPPELPKTLFGWIIPLIKIGDEEMLENVGLDALLMLKFVTMCIQIFSLCTIFGILVFIPITMTSDYSHLAKTTTVSRISIAVIADGDQKLIAYLIFAYVFTFITFFFLKKSYHEYVYLRAKFLLKQSKMMVSRSVVVTGIPQHLRSDQALSEYYESLDIGPVESCYVVREVHRLNTMIKKRANALICLEDAYATYWGNPCRIPGYDPDRILDDVEMYKKVLNLADQRPDSSSDEEEQEPGVPSKLPIKKKQGNTTFFKGLVEPKKQTQQSKRPTVKIGGLFGLFGKKVDAIEYYTKLFDDLDKTVSERRKSPNFEMTNVAFVTFEHMSSAVIASQIAINPEPFNCRTIMAWEPRDILWESVGIRGRERIVREIIIWTITVVICLCWTVPIGFVSSLLSVKSIAKINPGLAESIDKSSIATMIFDSFVPTILLNIFTSVLPFILDALGYYQGLRSRSAVAESTLSKYYFFLIFFALIFYSVADVAVETIIISFTHNISEIPEFIADVLPSLAPFFINYTILQTFLVMPMNMLLLGSIIVRGFYHMFMCKTPRQHAENRAPWAFNYGIGYPAPLLVFAIVFEYSLICPLILLFGTIYFCITYVVYKYQFLYVYFRPYEAAGKLWTMTIPRIIFTLILFQFTMMGLFLLGKSFVLAGLCIPLVFFTIMFRFLLNKAYSENGHNLPMQLLRANIKRSLNGSDSEEDDSSCDELSDSERVPTPDSKTAIAVKDAKTKEEKLIARNRWKKAAFSAVNLRSEPSVEDKSVIIRPRHRKLVLDEDDYEATPDRLTDYRQPPMQLNAGLLDAGLKKYGNPLLVGVLPQLWLPVKLPVEGEEKKADIGRRRSDLLHNRISGGGNLAQHLAEILRKVESENKSEADMKNKESNPKVSSAMDDGAEDALIEVSKKKARKDAENIVTGKPNPNITALRSLFHRGAIKKTDITTDSLSIHGSSLKNSQHTDDATMDSVEKGQHGNISDIFTTNSTTSSESIHQIYYHHPERRKSHTPDFGLPLPRRPQYKQSGLSAPAVTPNFEDSEALASSIIRPDTQNSRHSSAPLINKSNKEV